MMSSVFYGILIRLYQTSRPVRKSRKLSKSGRRTFNSCKNCKNKKINFFKNSSKCMSNKSEYPPYDSVFQIHFFLFVYFFLKEVSIWRITMKFCYLVYKMFENVSPDLVRSGKFGCPVLSSQSGWALQFDPSFPPCHHLFTPLKSSMFPRLNLSP